MGEKFAEFDQYQLGKHGKKMKKNKIPIDFFGASSKDDSDQGNGSNMREWVGLNTKFDYSLRKNTLAPRLWYDSRSIAYCSGA